MMIDCWYKQVCNQECSESCIRYQEMVNLVKFSKIPEHNQYPKALTPEKCDYNTFCVLADIKANVENFVDNGENLYISSQYTGNGKTTWAIKLMLKYFDCVWAGNGFKPRGIFINVPAFLTQLKLNISTKDTEFEDTIKLLADVDLVIWDDIASTVLTNYEHSQLLTYIDSRISNGKANIFTGNLIHIQDLNKTIGVRLTSRLLSGRQLIFYGKDRRINGTATNT